MIRSNQSPGWWFDWYLPKRSGELTIPVLQERSLMVELNRSWQHVADSFSKICINVSEKHVCRNLLATCFSCWISFRWFSHLSWMWPNGCSHTQKKVTEWLSHSSWGWPNAWFFKLHDPLKSKLNNFFHELRNVFDPFFIVCNYLQLTCV